MAAYPHFELGCYSDKETALSLLITERVQVFKYSYCYGIVKIT
jgi:hypothetical protein